MTPFLPQVTARELIRVAISLGFDLDRQKGSHAVYIENRGQRTIVADIDVSNGFGGATCQSCMNISDWS